MYPSQRPYNPRAFEHFWKPFIRGFQALGVSHYSLFHSKTNIFRIFYFICLCSLHIGLMCFAIRYGHSHNINIAANFPAAKRSALMYYVSFMSVAGNILAHIMAHLEPLFTRKHEQEIYRKLNEIDEIFATKLNYVTDFRVIRRKFIGHTIVFFIFTSILAFSYALYELPQEWHSITMFLVGRFIAVIIIRGRRCYMAFHVNNMSNILEDLQILLKRQQENYRSKPNEPATASSENIRYLRDVYSNIWLIKNLLSNCCGWAFITFLMEFSFELINSSYWAYVNIKVYKSSFKIKQIMLYMTSIIVNFVYLCKITERCEIAGREVSLALHTPSNYEDRNYQRFIRIFSLQLRKQPIEITMKDMFTFNYALLKSTIVLITTYVAIVIQFQISDENMSVSVSNITNTGI